MYRKLTDANSAYEFSKPLCEADALRATARYRRCGYDAIHVTLPT